jgi:hypothetical protein
LCAGFNVLADGFTGAFELPIHDVTNRSLAGRNGSTVDSFCRKMDTDHDGTLANLNVTRTESG